MRQIRPDHEHGRSAQRARSAARHAERRYPGPLGRLVARELEDYAESAACPGTGELVESAIAEVLDRPVRRAAG